MLLGDVLPVLVRQKGLDHRVVFSHTLRHGHRHRLDVVIEVLGEEDLFRP
jgi:hypothetical protein